MSDQARNDYYARVGAMDLSPLWTTRLVPPLPRDQVKARPHLWDYDRVVRPVLLDAGPLITAKEAQRRVLTLENPGLGGSHRILESLYAGLQLILPGEVAPAHRHSPSALRFIIEGDGAYTAVSGEKSVMKPGDFIITPSMTWHDHGHEGQGPVVWMDGLDIPMLGLFGAMFFETYPDDSQPQRRQPGDSLARYGANMRPVNDAAWTKPESPIFSYPYERSRDALEQLRRTGEWDPTAGLKLEYIDPTRGGSAMPTISTFLQLLPKGFSGARYRTTENTVYSVVEGTGRAIVGDGDDAVVLSWKPRDIFAIPCWVPHRLESDADATLFSFSDRTAQVKLGIWRDDRGNH
jgi:gentisate 1,2-dioxygenase